MDKRELVARAIAQTDPVYAEVGLLELHWKMADAAIAALEPVRICAKCGHPENNHPYRHPFVGI
jgi:hypothetical protein